MNKSSSNRRSPAAVEKGTLTNGITVLLDRAHQFRTAAIAVNLLGGSRDESSEVNGLTHLLEHVLFKRTKRSGTRLIAERIDALGGEVNAFTDAESFCLHGSVPREDAMSLLDLLAELLLEPGFTDEDVEIEKEIVRQEILEAQDDPHDAAYQRFRELFWPENPLGRPVFGTLESTHGFGKAQLIERLQTLLVGRRLIVTVVGDIEIEEITSKLERLFSGLPAGTRPEYTGPSCGTGFGVAARPVKQVNCVIAHRWPGIAEPQYLAGLVFSNVLGHGNSSRLFQKLREESGLCYDIDASVDAYPDTSALTMGATFERKSLRRAMDLLAAEMRSLLHEGVTQEEFERSIKLLKAQLAMEDDSLRGRLGRALESEICFERYVSADEVLQKLNRMRLADVQEFASRTLLDDRWLLVFGGDVRRLSVEELFAKGSWIHGTQTNSNK